MYSLWNVEADDDLRDGQRRPLPVQLELDPLERLRRPRVAVRRRGVAVQGERDGACGDGGGSRPGGEGLGHPHRGGTYRIVI